MQRRAEVKSPWSESPLGHLLSLRLGFPICKMGPPQEVDPEDSEMLCEQHMMQNKCSHETVPTTTIQKEVRTPEEPQRKE